MFVAEFQAIVLAAATSSPLGELVSTPKCLLPVGNFPLIYYPLQWLKKNGFEGAIVVVLESSKPEVAHALSTHLDSDFYVEYVALPDEAEWGTADVLRDLHLKQKIKTDMLVVSCDLFTTISLQEMANLFRKHDASLTAVFYANSTSAVIIPGSKSTKRSDREFVGIDPNTSRLVFSASQADMSGTLSLPKALLIKYPTLKIHVALKDAHIYLLKRWILDLLCTETKMSSIRSDLVPYLIRKQHRSCSGAQLSSDFAQTSLFTQPHSIPSQPESDCGHVDDQLERICCESRLALMGRSFSTWTDHQGDMSDAYFGNSIRCYSYLVKQETCFRVNSLAAFCEANRQAAGTLQLLTTSAEVMRMIHPTVKVTEKSQVGTESLIGEQTSIGDKVSIKKSNVGRNCKIADRAKISGCVLMDDVSVGESCNIQNSIICGQVEVGEKSEIKDCLIGNRFEVDASSKLTSETLTDSERLIEF